jgi:tyrosyl-tRNA synthetase
MEVQELMKLYNSKLKRYYDALDFFESTTSENIDKYHPLFVELCGEIDKVQKEIEKFIERKMTKEEIMQGFVI